jgi:hypothetical protein
VLLPQLRRQHYSKNYRQAKKVISLRKRFIAHYKTDFMKTKALAITSLSLLAAGCSTSVDLVHLPEPYPTTFRAGPYITSAIKLQELGREKGCREMAAAGKDPRNGDQIIALCQMLFAPRKDGKNERPRLGVPGYIAGTGASDWPLEPITLVENIPFAIINGYAIFGVRESGDKYLRRCMSGREWSTTRFQEPTRGQMNDALAKLLSSPKWKHPLSQYERDPLRAQIGD